MYFTLSKGEGRNIIWCARHSSISAMTPDAVPTAGKGTRGSVSAECGDFSRVRPSHRNYRLGSHLDCAGRAVATPVVLVTGRAVATPVVPVIGCAAATPVAPVTGLAVATPVAGRETATTPLEV